MIQLPIKHSELVSALHSDMSWAFSIETLLNYNSVGELLEGFCEKFDLKMNRKQDSEFSFLVFYYLLRKSFRLEFDNETLPPFNDTLDIELYYSKLKYFCNTRVSKYKESFSRDEEIISAVISEFVVEYLEGKLKSDKLINDFYDKIYSKGLQFKIKNRRSEKYVLNLICLEVEKQTTLLNNKLEHNNDRIHCLNTVEDIESYFMKLATTKGSQENNRPILSSEDVKHFLHANFVGFDPPKEKKHLKLNLTNKSNVSYFMYYFHQNKMTNTNRKNKAKFSKLIIDNFDLFRNDNELSLKSNMQKKPKKYLFD